VRFVPGQATIKAWVPGIDFSIADRIDAKSRRIGHCVS
jgi:hypothetical protein